MEKCDPLPIDLKQVVYRRAEAGDYQGVLDISEGLYGERDIVPAMYHDYLKDPLRVVYVAVYKGRVVCFAMNRIIDNGTTAEGEAFRTHPDFRGLGIFNELRRISLKDAVLPKFPGIKKIRLVTTNIEAMSDNKRLVFVPRSLRSVIEIAWKVPVSAVEQAMEIYQAKYTHTLQRETASLRQASRSDAKELFTNNDFRSKYIPTGILVRDNHTFCLDCPQNIPLLLGDTCKNIFISIDPKNKIESISFGTGIEMDVTMVTLRYGIDYYGPSQQDLMKAHIVKHIENIPTLFKQSQTAKNIYIHVWALDATFKKADLEAVVGFTSKDLGLDSGTERIPEAQQVVMENRKPIQNWT